jgi:hypothetical protein
VFLTVLLLSRSAMATPPPGGGEKSTVVPPTPDTSVLPTAAGSAAPFFVTTPVGQSPVDKQSKSITPQSLMEVSGLAKASDGITPAVGSTLLQQQGVAPASAHITRTTVGGLRCNSVSYLNVCSAALSLASRYTR